MRSLQPGVHTSDLEVVNIDRHGAWLYVKGAEYFLPYEKYRWFKDAKVADILGIQLLHDDHLYWPSLDVNLSVKSLQDPEAYPLVYR